MEVNASENSLEAAYGFEKMTNFISYHGRAWNTTVSMTRTTWGWRRGCMEDEEKEDEETWRTRMRRKKRTQARRAK